MACVLSRVFLLLALSQSLCGLVDAGQKRPKGSRPNTASRPLVGAAWARTRDVTESLQHVLGLSLGQGVKTSTEVRLPRLREALRPLFNALPKNAGSKLGRSTVRYALHRHFMHHHGMYLKGLDPAGEAWNTSSPTEILEDRVPSYVMHKFEERLDGGFDLEELSLMAATLEHFVHLDAVERLKVIYQLTNRSTEEDISDDDVTGLMERFLILQITGFSHHMTSQHLESKWKHMVPHFPSWPGLQTWLRTVQESVLNDEIDGENRVHGGAMNFEAVKRVLEAVLERFGRQQDSDCKVMRDRLRAMEDGSPGRVKLSNFYQGPSGQFVEKKEYLMTLGAIEEKRSSAGEAAESYVLIPNYLQSITNCLPSSSMYTVCCLNQCEELLRHLEVRIGSPTATPQEIVKIVEALPSVTVEAPRSLPDVLLQRLQEIALTHDLGGRVPLHGRLFSQWLHHAYPRECPMPAKSGTTRPVTAEDWLRETNTSSTHTRPEISELLRVEQKDQDEEEEDEDDDEEDERRRRGIWSGGPVEKVDAEQDALPWDLDEELVFSQAKPSLLHELRVILRALAMIGASIGLFMSIAQLATSALRVANGSPKKPLSLAGEKVV